MSRGRGTAATIGIVAATTLVAGCGALGDLVPGRPDRSDYAQVLQSQERVLRNVDVTRVSDAKGEWKRIHGTADLAEHLYLEVPSHPGEFCPGAPKAAFESAVKRLFPGARGPWTISTPEGTRVDLAHEMILKKVEDPTKEKDFVSSGGWTWATMGGDYSVPGKTFTSRGAPSWLVIDFDPSRVITTEQVAATCDEARRG